jgi:uncharacterized coiled-coil DUF342 family protein
MSKVVNLTPALLRRIIAEEKQKLVNEAKKNKKPKSHRKGMPSGKVTDVSKVAKDTKEVQASEMASTIADKVDHMKKLQKEGAEHAQRLSEINEEVQKIRREIIENI